MDFALTEEQQAIVDVATQIFGDLCRPERLREVESGGDWFHEELWNELAKAGLLGICLPAEVGGQGLGFLEACLLLEQLGRVVAPVPLHPTLIAGLAIASLGSRELQSRWLPGVSDGSTVLTLALSEPVGDPREPVLGAVHEKDAWVLTGEKTVVPFGHLAAAVVVTATDSAGIARAFVVPTTSGGLNWERQDTFNHEPAFRLVFEGVVLPAGNELGGTAGAVGWIVDRAIIGLCAIAAGVSDAGMRLTASYVSERKQFGRAIGTFQAVGHRLADCFIDSEAIRLSMLLAGSRLAEGAEASKEVAVAKYWASLGGSRVGHAGLHLHGGTSIDLDYPIHRYFLWAKHLEFSLGAATAQLARLGAFLANEPVHAV
ncbi:MAG: acyl-CoA/acyl-ACP dehydrogenase [Acidimicrobiales bacterium]|nr:acyl-CoA/acyl-ACP dehydrogenase [Acidimicrobiales bacterium]